jgi:hypothetical protein
MKSSRGGRQRIQHTIVTARGPARWRGDARDSLTSQLEDAVRDVRAQLPFLAFARAFSRRILPAEALAGYLRALAGIYSVLGPGLSLQICRASILTHFPHDNPPGVGLAPTARALVLTNPGIEWRRPRVRPALASGLASCYSAAADLTHRPHQVRQAARDRDQDRREIGDALDEHHQGP